MSRVGAKNRKSIITTLTLLKSAIFNIILRAFIRDIINKEVKYLVLKYIISSDRFLLGIYTTAEEARRAKLKLQKFIKKERKLKKLNFYKSVI